MAAGMGDRHLVAVGIGDGHGARVGRAGVFPDGQGVQFGPEQNGGPGTVGQDANHSRAADAGLDRGAIFLQPPGDTLGGVVLLVGQSGMPMQILVERLLVGTEGVVGGQDLVGAIHDRSVPFLAREDPQEEQEDVQHVEKDRCRQQGRGIDVLGAP